MFKAGAIGLLAVSLIAAAPIPSPNPLHGPAPSPSQSNTENQKNHTRAEKKITESGPNSPTRVQIVSCDNHDPNAAQGPSQCENEPTPDWWMIGLTFGLVIIGAGQVGLFWWQLRLINTSLRDAKAAADAAKLGAEAAKESADTAKATVERMKDTAERELRAYVGVLGGNVAFDTIEGKPVFRTTLVIKNAGKTPAYAIKSSGGMKGGVEFDTGWAEEKTEFPQNSVLLPNAETELRLFMKEFDGPKSKSGKPLKGGEMAYTFVFGRIEYTDAFKEPRWTNFRFTVSGDLLKGVGKLHPCEDGNDAN
jgi:hypothetical protein